MPVQSTSSRKIARFGYLANILNGLGEDMKSLADISRYSRPSSRYNRMRRGQPTVNSDVLAIDVTGRV